MINMIFVATENRKQQMYIRSMRLSTGPFYTNFEKQKKPKTIKKKHNANTVITCL